MVYFKRILFLFRLLLPFTFARSQKAGLRQYQIIQRADLHYWLMVLPFSLFIFIGLPVWLAPLMIPAALNVDFPLLNRVMAGGLSLLALSPLMIIFMFLFPSKSRDEFEISDTDKELEHKYPHIFTIGSGVIDLKNTPDEKKLPISEITNITIRNQDILEHQQVPNKKYSAGPARHRKSVHAFNINSYSDVFYDLFVPPTFSVDVETVDYVLTLTRNLHRRKALALVQSIARDMGLRLKQSPKDITRYEASFDVIR